MLWLSKFDAKETASLLPSATVMMGVPTYYTRLLAEPSLTREASRSIRLFVSGSAPLLPETFDAFQARTGHAILERYGMTETGMITSNPLEGTRVAGTVGKPLPGEAVRVVDGAGVPCPPGTIGHIEVKGPNVFSGYWQMPDKTREEFSADGFFKTGDMGEWVACDEGHGHLRLVGRAKDLIITGGLNVYPLEVEERIDSLDGVVESAVIGLPDPDFGEAVTAVVVARSRRTCCARNTPRSRANRYAGRGFSERSRQRSRPRENSGQHRMTSASVMIEPTSPLLKNTDMLPADASIDWRKAVSAMSPNTSASTIGANGYLSFLKK